MVRTSAVRAFPGPPTRRAAILLLLGSALLWSLGGLFIKLVEWHPLAIAGTRALIAAATITLCLRGRLHFTGSAWQIAGALAYAATTISFVAATKLTTAANAILLQYTAPVFVALLAPWILGEPSRRRDWTILAVTLAGMVLFFFDGFDLTGQWGNLVAIGSAVSFAMLTISLRKQKEGSPVESIVLGNVITAAIGLWFARPPLPDATGWVVLVALGTVQLGFSYLLYARAIRGATAMEAALVPMLEPILNPIWVAIFLAELPGPFALVGGAIVLGTVIARAVLAMRERPTGSPPRRGAFPAATT